MLLIAWVSRTETKSPQLPTLPPLTMGPSGVNDMLH